MDKRGVALFNVAPLVFYFSTLTKKVLQIVLHFVKKSYLCSGLG